MSFVMTVEERESFLAGVHVGVLSVARDGLAPLSVPVWYAYEPGGELWVWIFRDSVKERAIRKAGRLAFLVQTEVAPYQYVSIEGPVVAGDERPTREQAVTIASRYLPLAEAEAYVDYSLDDRSVLVRVRPERWLSNDQSKT